MVDITGIPKAKVLKALFDSSKQQGMGFFAGPQGPMKIEDAEAICADGLRFDYLHGKVLKVDISGDSFDPRLYDRDLGDGAAARAIAAIR